MPDICFLIPDQPRLIISLNLAELMVTEGEAGCAKGVMPVMAEGEKGVGGCHEGDLHQPGG